MSSCEIQSLLDYDRGQCADSSCLNCFQEGVRYLSGVISVRVLKLVTLTKSMTCEHSVNFFKDFAQYSVTTVAIHKPFATHNQWTGLSDLRDQFCLAITFLGEIENSEFSRNSKIS